MQRYLDPEIGDIPSGKLEGGYMALQPQKLNPVLLPCQVLGAAPEAVWVIRQHTSEIPRSLPLWIPCKYTVIASYPNYFQLEPLELSPLASFHVHATFTFFRLEPSPFILRCMDFARQRKSPAPPVFGGFNFLMWIAFVLTLACVIRDGQQQHIPAADIVVGDVVILNSGDRVPADLRVVQTSADLRFDRSIFTGESDMIPGVLDSTSKNALETPNLVPCGTAVWSRQH
ncbi:E1-E2 ATPase-domain-containing protein [Pisolithus croceorrhizus]|nr:E1-E2 ATPase-domain-containing protein [Pisolithus croceorrhizus]